MRGRRCVAEISAQALTVAIQAVDREIRELRQLVQSDDAEPEDMLMLDDWTRAAEEMEEAYDAAARVALNLPPYDALVSR